jgi:hypothetical protein
MYLALSALYLMERHELEETHRRADMRAELLRQGLLDARASRADSAGVGGVARSDGPGRVGQPGPDLRWLEDYNPAPGRE